MATTPVKTGRMRRWIGNISLLLISVFLSTFLLFGALELFPSLPDKLRLNRIYYYALKNRFIPDSVLVFRTRPHYRQDGLFGGDIRGLFTGASFTPVPYHAQYDGNGFRSQHGEAPVDIVNLGDSYMDVGESNDDTFAARLEHTSGLKTANYGRGWYGPFQYLEVLRRYALKNQPRIAIFAIFEGNDLTDVRNYLTWRQGGPYYHFVDLSSRGFVSRYVMALKSTADRVGNFTLRSLHPRTAAIHLGNRTYHTIFVYDTDPRSQEELAQSIEIKALDDILKEFKAVCAQHSITPIVLFVPTKAHIYLPYSEMPRFAPDRLQRSKDYRPYVEAVVQKTVGANGIQWISLTQPFEAAAREGRFLYYETDTHWNSEGRQLAAEFVASLFREKPF
jgi:hypothetical protein